MRAVTATHCAFEKRIYIWYTTETELRHVHTRKHVFIAGDGIHSSKQESVIKKHAVVSHVLLVGVAPSPAGHPPPPPPSGHRITGGYLVIHRES